MTQQRALEAQSDSYDCIVVILCHMVAVFRSTENQMYEMAVSLARTYRVPLWDVYMIHLEFLFDENESQYVNHLRSF